MTTATLAHGAPLTAATIDDAQAEALAGVFAALADPGRVKILNQLSLVAPEAVSLTDLTAMLGFTQPAVSYHLKILREAGLISRDRRGQFNYYALRAEALGRVAALVGHDPLADAS